MPYHASQLYSRNVTALLLHLAPEGRLTLDFDDEITAGACVARPRGDGLDGRHARLRADDPRARDLPRDRGDLEGADDAAHAADVRHERDPRDRPRRRDPRRGPRRGGHADARSSASARSCSGRRTSSAASSSPTGCSRCSRGARPGSPNEQDDDRPALPGHDRDLHPRAPLPLLAEARAAGESARGGRDGARDRGHARAGRARELRLDRAGDGDRRGDRRRRRALA